MEKFIVIVPAAIAVPAVGDYRIVAESSLADQTYKKVYGPETIENCRKWVDEKRPVSAASPVVPTEPEQSRNRSWISYTTTGWISYLLIVAGLFGLMFLTIELSGNSIEKKADKLTPTIELQQPLADCAFVTTEAQKAFINSQRAEIVKYATSHRTTAIEFYKYFYNTYAVFSLFGIFAAISLAVIVRTGIDEASPHLITVFLVSTAIVLVYQGFFGVFQQKTNIDNNAKLFVSYGQLNTRIDTYCATGSLPMVDPKMLLVQRLSKTPDSVPSSTTNQTNSNARTNSNSSANSSTLTNSSTASAPNSSEAKVPIFSVALSPDDFINYIGWQMEQLKAISIALDDKQIVAIDSSKLTLAKP